MGEKFHTTVTQKNKNLLQYFTKGCFWRKNVQKVAIYLDNKFLDHF